MGIFTGVLVSAVGIPSFVVTLATFLAYQGVLLWIIGTGGTVADHRATSSSRCPTATCRSPSAG